MKIAVLGAGLTGLTAAYYLSKNGHQVSVFEKESAPGGLASTFKLPHWDWPLEYFYHHFFANDYDAINLIRELGLGSKLFFKKPTTAIYYESAKLQSKIQNHKSEIINHKSPIYPLDSPVALLQFPHLTLFDKLRTGAIIVYLKILSNYKSMEQKTAENWLKKTMGERPFEILWKPLLVSKFGKFAPQITAAWFWARIKKRTKSLGYLEDSFQTLADRLVEKIKENNGQIFLNKEVKKIEKINSHFELCTLNFELVISTLPTPIFLKIAPPLPKDYRQRLSQTPHLWAQTLVLEMNKPFLNNTYWLNINDNSFPFLALVEHTNFIDKSHYDNRHIIYIGNYLLDGHPYLKKSAHELLEIFEPYLKKINPDFRMSHVTCRMLHTSPFAQPVITVGHQPPTLQTPIPHLYLANQDCVYPWDRGINYAIELGRKVSEAII